MIKYSKLGGDEWIELRRTDCGYTYMHETRCDGQLVAIMAFTKDNNYVDKILGRFEWVPAHDDGTQLVSITGGVEDNDPVKTALMELEEEAGIIAEEKDLIKLGEVKSSKAADTTVHLFGIDMTGKEDSMVEPQGDGSDGEKGCYVDWVNTIDIINAKDPLLHALYMRLTESEM